MTEWKKIGDYYTKLHDDDPTRVFKFELRTSAFDYFWKLTTKRKKESRFVGVGNVEGYNTDKSKIKPNIKIKKPM